MQLTYKACDLLTRQNPILELSGREPDAGSGTAMTVKSPPDRPGRPDQPELLPPNKMPKRKGKGVAGRVALLHAVAHIELNAIDLAWDMIARFAPEILENPERGTEFIRDWLKVAAEEAKHFKLLSDRLKSYGSFYGALPAHNGLWDAAYETRNDILARLTIVPLILEARGLDVTPAMITRFESAKDNESASVLGLILHEEIGHVQIGAKWLFQICSKMGLDPKEEFRKKVSQHFRGAIKRPLNIEARTKAGFPLDFIEEL